MTRLKHLFYARGADHLRKNCVEIKKISNEAIDKVVYYLDLIHLHERLSNVFMK